MEIPAERVEQAGKVAGVIGDEVFSKFPFLDGMTPMAGDLDIGGNFYGDCGSAYDSWD